VGNPDAVQWQVATDLNEEQKFTLSVGTARAHASGFANADRLNRNAKAMNNIRNILILKKNT
jgi:hypothetical protein